MNEVINISNLTKKFSYKEKSRQVGWLKNIFFPKTREILAVDDIAFSIKKGERVAFIGPNGAGKSTTIKMMTGILFPTSGEINVLGLDPTKARKKLAYKIGTVFGQRSQLLPNLPLTDSLEFFGTMYDMPKNQIKKRINELSDIFDLGDFALQPVRKLSLGQRMRAEIACSLMHNPEIIFLDEPTIGLDIVSKKVMRDLLIKINKQEKTTIFLTSHDVGDIESLCERTIIINHGKLVKDMNTADLSKEYVFEKFAELIPSEKFLKFPELPTSIKYLQKDVNKITVSIDINLTTVQEALKKLLDVFDVEDIDVYNADLETVIRHIYEKI